MSPLEKQRFYRAIDFTLILFVGIFMVYYVLGVRKLSVYYLLPLFLSFLWILILDGMGVYEYENLNNFKNSVIYLLLSLLFTGLLYGLMYIKFSGNVREFLVIHLSISLLSLILVRTLFFKINIFNKFRTRVVIASEDFKRIKDFLKNYPEYEIAGIIEHNPVMTKENGEILKKIEADEIIVNYGENSFENQGFMKSLLKRGYRIKYFEDIYEKLTGRISLDFLNKKAYLNKFLKEVKEDRFYDFIKRIFDIVGAVVGGVIYLLMFPFIAIAVKFDSKGPLFYKHKRTGKNGKPFTIWKIRTMVKDAEKGKAIWAKRDDPRITRVGKILRKTRLDEFTQLFNILKGEMSAVGPRPERPELEEGIKKHIPHYDLRYLVKPGMAGWAMVNYDYVDSVEGAKIRHEYDLYYVKNRSLYLDFKIFLRALFALVMFRGR